MQATHPALPAQVPTRPALPIEIDGLKLTLASPTLWRVTRRDGAVAGHLEYTPIESTDRFTARRLPRGGTRSIPVGSCWSWRDAVELLR
ncbi:MAG TPA: hypothetical protein VFU07_08110 [Candidatus Lumbricidophila sp.]|nr:hypothetical protein [Candidatus Lumbricidophila sp.]